MNGFISIYWRTKRLEGVCTSIYAARKRIARDTAAMRGVDLSQIAEVLMNGP
jgi:hypothetical protein